MGAGQRAVRTVPSAGEVVMWSRRSGSQVRRVPSQDAEARARRVQDKPETHCECALVVSVGSPSVGRQRNNMPPKSPDATSVSSGAIANESIEAS